MQGGVLYATEPFIKLYSKTYQWTYLFTQKDTRQKKLDEGVKADNKKYIYRATGKFSQTNSNG